MMPRRLVVEPGMRFGSWAVAGLAEPGKGGRMALCKCACGAEHVVGFSALCSGRSRSCRVCAGTSSQAIASGTRFGSWTVLGVAPVAKAPSVLCRCDCGYERVHTHAVLRSGKTTRCKQCCLDHLRRTRAGSRPTPWKRGKRHFIAGVGTDQRTDQLFFSSSLCHSWDDAVQWLADACDLGPKQRASLHRDGFLRLRGPEDGASYVEIMRCDCVTPHVHSDDARAGAAE